MALLGPNPEDLRKLDTEATQIVNQKFLITTAAITVFGLISTQIISNQLMADAGRPVAPPVAAGAILEPVVLGWPAFFGASLLNLMLLVLFFYSTILAGMLRVITTYLVETRASSWEIDWVRYRRLGHLGYTRAQAVVFLFLGATATAYPVVFAFFRGCELGPRAGLIAHFVIAAATMGFIACLGLVGWPDLESQPDQKWRMLRDGAGGVEARLGDGSSTRGEAAPGTAGIV